MAGSVAHKALTVAVALMVAVAWPAGLASRAGAAPSDNKLAQEEQTLKAEELGLTQQQLELALRILNAALLAAGIHPSQLSQAERQQIAQVSGLSLPQVNDALKMYEVVLRKDNPTQIPVSQPIVLVFIAAALIFIPSWFSSAGGTLFPSDGQSGAIEGVEEFGK